MNVALLQRLRKSLGERQGSSLRRKLVARAADDPRINLADNDYLGLARDPVVVEAGIAALRNWGASSSASPLVTGYTQLHQQLEQTLAAWQGYAHGLVLNTGFAANAAVLGGLPKAGDVVLADRLVHASMLEGIMASGARLRRFPHNDLDALELMLHEEPALDGVIFVVTESVFAVPGIGRLTIDAVMQRDYPVIQGVILFVAGVYVLVNLLIDLTYSLLDPRIRY